MKRGLKKLIYTSKIRFAIYLLIGILLIISSFLFTFSIINLSNIENLLRILILILLYLFIIFYVYKVYKYIINKNKIKYIIINIISFLISLVLLFISYYINAFNGAIDLMVNSKNYYTGYLISLNTDNIKNVGMIDNVNDIEGYKVANKILEDYKLNYEIKEFDNYEDMVDDLYNKKIDAIFVPSNYSDYFIDHDNFKEEIKIVYKKTIEEQTKKTNYKNSKLDKPFTILLMGVDSTDNTIETANSFNGDTLMLVTFNPKTLNATMFSIPRDLYVPIACKKGAKAKINTSSVGGIDCVMDTIKDLMDINIDYYARINFKGVVDLVEALDGIYVNVTYPFCEQDSNRDFSKQICLKAGMQTLNGEQTLAYARHRHTLPTGDLQRIQNQQLIVEAIAKKLLSSLTDFDKILEVVGKNVATNLTRKEILSSYDILKQMILNSISDKEGIVVSKAYLEVYDKSIYNEKRDTYSAALGYYENSLEKIKKFLKVNLELEEPEIIKEFSFDANSPYEQTLVGKGEKNEVDNPTIPNFVGKDVSYVENWGSKNNITINKVMVSEGDSNFNSNVSIGLVGAQSIKAGASLTNINSITIYINVMTEEDNNQSENEENEDNIIDDPINDLFDIN